MQPVPPRYWWLKRILATSGVLLVGLVGLRLWWGWDAHRRLQAEIDRCIAAGEPVYPADFNPHVTIPDDQNAAKFLQDAELALNLTQEQDELIDTLVENPARVSDHLTSVRGIADANEAALGLIRKATSLDQVDWGVRFRSPAIGALLPNLSGQRTLARLLCVSAAQQHATGEDQEAVETIRHILAQADRIDLHPTLIAHLVGLAVRAAAVRQIEWITPTLQVSADGATGADQRPHSAARLQLETLIAGLLREEQSERAHVWAMWSERMWELDVLLMIDRGDTTLGQMFVGGPITGSGIGSGIRERVWTLLFMPAWRTDGLRSFRYMSELANAVRSPTYSGAHLVPPVEGCSHGPRALLRPFTCMILPEYDSSILIQYRLIAERRMAATALAMRLYELEHGHRPLGLAELVPDYLPAVPLDPFSDADMPLGYRPEASPPALYSVNRDGKDDGGQYALQDDGSVDREILDLIFFLNGDRPYPTESEAQDNTMLESDERKDEPRHNQDEERHDPKG